MKKQISIIIATLTTLAIVGFTMVLPSVMAAPLNPSLTWGSQSITLSSTDTATIGVALDQDCPNGGTYSGVLSVTPSGYSSSSIVETAIPCGTYLHPVYPNDFPSATTNVSDVYQAEWKGTTTVNGGAFDLTDAFIVGGVCLPSTTVTVTQTTTLPPVTSTATSTATATQTQTITSFGTVTSTIESGTQTVTQTITQPASTSTVTQTSVSTITTTQEASTSTLTATNTVMSTQTITQESVSTVGPTTGGFEAIIILPVPYTSSSPTTMNSYLNETTPPIVNGESGYTVTHTIVNEVSTISNWNGYEAFVVVDSSVAHGTTQIALNFNSLMITFINFPTTYLASSALTYFPPYSPNIVMPAGEIGIYTGYYGYSHQ